MAMVAWEAGPVKLMAKKNITPMSMGRMKCLLMGKPPVKLFLSCECPQQWKKFIEGMREGAFRSPGADLKAHPFKVHLR